MIPRGPFLPLPFCDSVTPLAAHTHPLRNVPLGLPCRLSTVVQGSSANPAITPTCALHRALSHQLPSFPPTSFPLLSSPGSTAEAARIIYPPEAQTIIVTKGQSLILECVASGIPPPRVTWAKDGSSVSAYNKTRFLLSNLLIDPTSEEDSGTYSCTADNGVGEAGAAFIFYNVQVFGECCCSPCFGKGLDFLHVFQGRMPAPLCSSSPWTNHTARQTAACGCGF